MKMENTYFDEQKISDVLHIEDSLIFGRFYYYIIFIFIIIR